MKLLFTSGTARGGTNFRTLILKNHCQISLSIDAFIPLFRFYRNSLLKSSGIDKMLLNGIPDVLDDYYFSDTKLQIMKAIQTTDPDIPFDLSQWEKLKMLLENRMKLASSNLIPHVDKLKAPTFREIFYNIIKVVNTGNNDNLTWVGLNENWAMEFFPLVARLVPDAKFVIHLRDPRAVVFSSEFAEPNPAKHPTLLSLARHLRKYFAFAVMLPNDQQLKGRLLITRYEPFFSDIEGETRRMCDFLNIDFKPDMVDISKFRKADGNIWSSDWNIYKATFDNWRKEMPLEMLELTEFICDPEMRLHGYVPESYDLKKGLSLSTYKFAIKNSRECRGWRTDFPEIERTLGSELYRKYMLASSDTFSTDEIERCFLFTEIFKKTQHVFSSCKN
jgi:hypothetical protein